MTTSPSVFRLPRRREEAPSRSPWSVRPGVVFPRTVSPSTNLREVAPGLYVGDQDAVEKSRDWTLVVDLCGSSRSSPRGKYPDSARVIRRVLDDGQPIPRSVMEALAHEVGPVVRRGGAVLVHCAAGHSRSASAAYGLLRVGWKLSHDEARRRVVTPRGLAGGWPMTETFRSVKAWADRRVFQAELFEPESERSEEGSWNS